MKCGEGFQPGADNMSGGWGDDRIFHSLVTFNPADQPENPDGHTDYIDCGPGNDEAWLNSNIDNDVAVNCEILHVG